MRNILALIGIVLVIAGTVVGSLIGFEAGKLTAFAVVMFGAGLAVANLWKERSKEQNKWFVILAMIFIGIGSFITGLTGFISETQLTSIIGYVCAVVLIIIGIVTAKLKKKE